MRTIKVTTKTPEQIAADFAATFADVQPDGAAGRVTQKERLEPYRKQIMKQRRRGLTWKQIAAGMRGPRIGERITEKILKAVFEPQKSASEPEKKQAVKVNTDPGTGKPSDVGEPNK